MILGVLGHSGSGKDAVADYLVKEHSFIKIAFSDPLKRICKEVFGFSYNQLWGPSEERNKPDYRYKGLTPRKALQLLGTEWGRALYEDVWVDYALRQATQIISLNGYGYTSENGAFAIPYNRPPISGVVIPDVRFQNEVNRILEAGGLILQVLRPGFEGQQAMAAGIQNHASETEMNKVTGITWTIVNDGSLEDLYQKVNALLNSKET